MSLSRFAAGDGFSMLRAEPGPLRGDATMDVEEMERVPGLFRRWELPLILQAGVDYRLEDAGVDAGGPLLAVYRRRDAEPAS